MSNKEAFPRSVWLQLLLIVLFGLTLFGCKGGVANKLSKDRNDIGDPPVVERIEPYAVEVGRYQNENIYRIYWKGNALDNTNMLESDVNKLGLRKYAGIGD